MRNLRRLDQHRLVGPGVVKIFGGEGDETCGVFAVPSPIDGARMHVIASSELGWDHVSVSRKNRCPNWQEMEHVKKLFFEDGETAMQLHVPVEDHLSHHPYTLHIWRPNDGREIPMPPPIMVALPNVA